MTGRCETKIPPEHSFLWLFEEALISARGGESGQEISPSEGSELTYLRLLSCVLNLKIVNFQLFFRRLASLRSKAWRLASVLQRAGLQGLLKARRQTKMERTGHAVSLNHCPLKTSLVCPVTEANWGDLGPYWAVPTALHSVPHLNFTTILSDVYSWVSRSDRVLKQGDVKWHTHGHKATK